MNIWYVSTLLNKTKLEFSNLVFSVFLLSLTVFSLGCKENLSVQSGNLGPNIKIPVISFPPSNPYYSQSSSLTIEGLCKTGSTLILSGASSQQTGCVDSEFSFVVNQAADGVYNLLISQDDEGNISSPASLIWNKKTSVSQPSITSPSVNPYSSSEAVLNIQGGCETGSTITLGNDGAGSTQCISSNFNINIPKFMDGNYNIDVIQTDLAGNQASVQVVWQKQSLSVIPNDPQVVVGSNQAFTITGGTSPYSVAITQNNSVGASYNSLTQTYTAGTLAGVTDVLQITDGQGFTRNINIQVLADVPDRFEYPTLSGDNQSNFVGQSFSSPLSIRVVDRYGNGVSNVPVLFQKTAGDVFLIGPMEKRTDATGTATVSVIQGYRASRSYVSVLPAIGNFPDVTSTGLSRARFLLISQSGNTGNYDLNYSTANNPENIVITDLNNDGLKDVLILNKGGPSISRQLGRGNGLFTSLTNLNGLCSGPSGMASADFNNDGFEDLILSCNGIGQYSYFSGLGNGTFNAAVTTAMDPLENFPVDVAVGDFNKDGAKDFLMVSTAANVIGVRFGNNNGTFAAPAIYATGSSPSKAIVADFNKDTFEDFAVINAADNTFSVFINNGNGTFMNQVVYGTGVAPSSITVGDFNSDTYPDVAITNNVEDNVGVFMNLTDGSFDLAINTPTGIGPIAVHAVDINSDNIQDLVVANISESTVSVLIGFDNGSFTPEAPLPSLLNPINLSSSDFNEDGLFDLIIISNGESKFQIIPGQSTGLGFVTDLASNPVKVISADLDGDGFLDKAVVNQASNSVSFFKGNGNGLFAPLSTLNVGNGPTDAVLVDLNNDSILDLVVVLNSVNVIRSFLGQGGGLFGAGNSFPTQAQPTSLVHGDFNKDGRVDVIVTCSGANRINFFPGQGDGTFGVRTNATSESQPTHITSGDFNEDYIPDVAVTNQSDSSVTVFLSNANGTFLTSTFSVEDGPNGIVSGFFNADGILDLAISNNLSASVSILRGRGDGTFDPAINFYAGPDPIGISKGDLNGNGREDLVVGNGINQGITLLFGSFGGDFSSNIFITTNLSSNYVSVDDVNNDQSLDLTVIDDLNSKMKVLLGL